MSISCVYSAYLEQVSVSILMTGGAYLCLIVEKEMIMHSDEEIKNATTWIVLAGCSTNPRGCQFSPYIGA